MKPVIRRLALAGLIVVLGSGVGRAEDVKQAYKAVQPLLSLPRSVVGETIRYPGGTLAAITSAVVTILPGEETVWHKHGVPLYAYILAGELTVDYGDKGTRTFTAGTDFMEAMDHWHRGANLGTAPVRILAVYLGAEGLSNVIERE